VGGRLPLSYEAGPAFDTGIRSRPPSDVPLLWMGLYSEPQLVQLPDRSPAVEVPRYRWNPSVARDEYERAITRIRELISAGETYQVNYTLRLRAPSEEDPFTLFLRMVHANRPLHSAYLDCGRFVVCSASPELFFRLDRGVLTSRPMKGTAGRGLSPAQDREKGAELRQSQKNRAENIMIVDMVRNDFGRVAQIGSVRVPRLFELERYPTVWQMTSTVTARSSATPCEILQALFPPASITGAPKAHTTAIIAGLETTPRGVYTGCIGYIAPGRRANFNVAIRTATVDRDAGSVEYGVGGGIVWDSTSQSEYEECLLKARIVTDTPPPFSLLETLLWEPGASWFLLDGHLQRLAARLSGCARRHCQGARAPRRGGRNIRRNATARPAGRLTRWRRVLRSYTHDRVGQARAPGTRSLGNRPQRSLYSTTRRLTEKSTTKPWPHGPIATTWCSGMAAAKRPKPRLPISSSSATAAGSHHRSSADCCRARSAAICSRAARSCRKGSRWTNCGGLRASGSSIPCASGAKPN
jgi:aminodeoxychorismate synthase component I